MTKFIFWNMGLASLQFLPVQPCQKPLLFLWGISHTNPDNDCGFTPHSLPTSGTTSSEQYHMVPKSSQQLLNDRKYIICSLSPKRGNIFHVQIPF
ncbi:hypothetical protein AVEN_8070-1 [Araneus ventricosus]|uniref:Uncharacterized protein n=1 Tax=Araneus ventricosus TaxID=182803 RepID=A0A4Y2NET1_ARAVE|nr:hypothetical protein AVEN_8070-1 [Araneus ventricosus]